MREKEIPLNHEDFEKKVGHVFDNKNYIITAFTHSSYSNEKRSKGITCKCNERLEFLGDSVLSLITSEYLFKTYPDMPEGDLSRVRAITVCEKTLCEFAKQINLGDYLLLGHGEELTNGRKRPSILADAFEAVLAALYLDGGMETVKSFLMPFITDFIENTVSTGHLKDYKTLLQQIVQQEHGELLEYEVIDESGPAHDKSFTVEAKLNSNVIGKGTGRSKQEAEQLAAKEALVLFGARD